MHIHNRQDEPQHCPLHNDDEGTRPNGRANLHRHGEPHDVAYGKNGCCHQNDRWGGKLGFLALVLDDADYHRLTRYQSATIDQLDPPTAMATAGTIHFASTPFEIMTFQEAQKKRQKVYEIQEAVTDIGVERIVASVA